MRFTFSTAPKILFAAGAITELGAHAEKLGSKAFLLTGKNTARAAIACESLEKRQLPYSIHPVTEEPTTHALLAAVTAARREQCDMVIAFGGGSVIDMGKAVAALLNNTEDLFHYLEVIGDAQPLTAPCAPCIAVPTTSGTGAEATANSVIASPEHRVKVSLRHPSMLPDLALIDPELTLSLPFDVTMHTGLDALTQLIEAFTSRFANPLTDGLCREGLACAARALPVVKQNGDDLQARENMAVGSLFSGMALANAKLGAVHGLAAPLGGLFHAPHGLVCAALLPVIMEANIKALQERAPHSPALDRFDEIARILTGDASARSSDAVNWVRDILKGLVVTPFQEFGMQESDVEDVVTKAQRASSMQGNPIPLTDDELAQALRNVL